VTTSYAAVPPPSPAPPTRRTADIALLLGLLSLPFTFLAGVPAIVFGVRALRVANQVGGRGRAWVGIGLGSVMTVAALVVLGLLGVRLVDGLRGVTALEGSARTEQRAAERAAVDDAALVQATGVSLDLLQAKAGVVLTHDPGATVDCIDSCSEAELEVTGAAAQSGSLARDVLLERLREQGYRDAIGGGAGCPALDPARPCRLRAPEGTATVQLTPDEAGAGYVLRING